MHTLAEIINQGINVKFTTEDKDIRKIINEQIALNCSINPELYAELLNGNSLLIKVLPDKDVEERVVKFYSGDTEFAGFYLAESEDELTVNKELERASRFVYNEYLRNLPIREVDKFGKVDYQPIQFEIIEFNPKEMDKTSVTGIAKTKIRYGAGNKIFKNYGEESKFWIEEVFKVIKAEEDSIKTAKALLEAANYLSSIQEYEYYKEDQTNKKIQLARDVLNSLYEMMLNQENSKEYELDEKKELKKFYVKSKTFDINPDDFQFLVYSNKELMEKAFKNKAFVDRLYTGATGDSVNVNLRLKFIR